MIMPVDDYTDLPDWIRPGAKLAALYLREQWFPVTVTKITKTQIVTIADTNRNAEYRFEREETRAFSNTGYRLRGNQLTTLVRRDNPHVIALRINTIAINAAKEVETARGMYGNPRANQDDRPVDERAMDLLDAIENAARTARRKVEALLDPSTIASAQYAQDLEA